MFLALPQSHLQNRLVLIAVLLFQVCKGTAEHRKMLRQENRYRLPYPRREKWPAKSLVCRRHNLMLGAHACPAMALWRYTIFDLF